MRRLSLKEALEVLTPERLQLLASLAKGLPKSERLYKVVNRDGYLTVVPLTFEGEDWEEVATLWIHTDGYSYLAVHEGSFHLSVTLVKGEEKREEGTEEGENQVEDELLDELSL